ncbi:MAG TPA: hypothetical protein PLC50_01020 [Alicycliphilus sp.]|jgi:hypothetical protein|uniref:CpsD/CapB family tyrosine-protein kinase n=1 Tax=Diaphorobacter limosus TaxID=3036128 RepID=A0ABZ0IXT6_9BURK|nr:hypothetical protein [Diaphorobacter sp. Y-1]MBP6753229.1 hypothetical protein [Alicycliphilus sp.]MCA0442132.1 hypothetical protein [Pseudomonadota bacterium]MBP7325847.1 hypothetical protein [Alicycliphilus sp.]MBP7328878.1 hypothetical protein [Alicycliphilus sp.]MBP8138663.1 hypothetical protein [Alicycliphilus sp.]
MLLDTAIHQAMGLNSITPQRELRLLPVVSQPDGGPWLEMLWQLCWHLQRLGYPVVVLDATAQESHRSPGLAQLLGARPWPGAEALNDASDDGSLAVLPAARGLAWLAGQAELGQAGALQRLQPLLRAYAAVVLYAPPEQLAPLLHGSTSVPLVMTGPGAQGMVRSYRQLKHMALHAGVRCTVAAIVAPDAQAQPRQTAEALATLARSARQHLGQHIHTTSVAAARAQDIQRLALQLLENAATLDPATPLLQPPGACATATHPDWSH